MPKKIFSGKDVIAILVKDFDFNVISQKGSHVKLAKYTINKKITTIVPLHKELATGTLKGILDLANINFIEFVTKK